MNKHIDNFITGYAVTYKPYTEAYELFVVGVQQGSRGDGHTFTGEPDDRTFYRLASTVNTPSRRATSVTTGRSLVGHPDYEPYQLTQGDKKRKYDTGEYTMPVPPVCTNHWDSECWIKFIDANGRWT